MIEGTGSAFFRAFVLAVLAGLGAFPTALLIILAVVVGHRLDESLGMPFPAFLLGLLAIAVPTSIVIMIFLARLAIRAAHGSSLPSGAVSPAPLTRRDEEEEI